MHWIACKRSMKIWKGLWIAKSLQRISKWWTPYLTAKRWIPVRVLVGIQGHQAGHQKHEKLCELVIAGEFGQVLRWVMKMRRCQTAEVPQQKRWRKLEHWMRRCPCVLCRAWSALCRGGTADRKHTMCKDAAAVICESEHWISLKKTLKFWAESTWWLWTGRQWQSWEGVGSQGGSSSPQPTPAPSFGLLLLCSPVGGHGSPPAFSSCRPLCKPLTNSTV